MPTSLSTPVVRRRPRCAKSPLAAAPEIVGKPDRGDRRDRWIAAESHQPADQRQPEAPVVDGGGAAGKESVEQLPSSVGEAAGVSSGGAVAEREFQLRDPQAGSNGVHRHPHLATETCGQRKARLARLLREHALARQRLLRCEARERPNERPACVFGDPEAAALALGERSDRQIAVRAGEGHQVSLEVGIYEQDATNRSYAFREGECLALSTRRQAEHSGAGALRRLGRPVPRAVVGHNYLDAGERLAHGLDRPRDLRLLVAGRDEDRYKLNHSEEQSRAEGALRRRRSA
jgi:hypothetical protein